MSVFDVLIHKMGAHDTKIRLEKPKESENDAVISEYPLGGLQAFQNGFARTRDADASTHKKGARRHVDASDEVNTDR